jgi:uncharacterized RDD family membrane protein YckC
MHAKRQRTKVEIMGTGSNQQIDFGHWILRAIAFVIDSIIIGIVTWALFTFVLYSLLFTGSLYWLYLGYGYYLIYPLVLGILEVLYFAILDAAWGGTIGKRIMGLQVQMTNGNKVPFDKAFIRNISKIYWIFLLLDWVAGLFTPGADRRQKYTDRMAGTTVVQTGKSIITIPQPSETPK